MPIYEYQCLECHYIFEKRQGFFDEPKAECPRCHHVESRRLITTPTIVFKGSGFYVTDNRSNGKASSNGQGTPSKNGEKSVDKPNDNGDKNSNGSDKADSSNGSSDNKKSESTKSESAKVEAKPKPEPVNS